MELTEAENINKYGKHCGHCAQNMLLPNEYEFTCISYGHNVIKRKHELTILQRKKVNFIIRLKYAEHKIFCICIEVYKTYEGDDFDKICEVLSTLKNKNLKINKILIKKSKDTLENSDFEQDYYSRTATSIYKIGRDSIRIMKRLAYYDSSYYQNINYYDLMRSILKCINENSWW